MREVMLRPMDRRARLVVIDDDPTFLALMCDLLEVSEGYEVLTHSRSEDAVDLIRRAAPDLVLLDVILGGRPTGWDVLTDLADDPGTGRIPVLVLSAAITSLREHGALLERTRARVLAKPFDMGKLLEMVNAALSDAPR